MGYSLSEAIDVISLLSRLPFNCSFFVRVIFDFQPLIAPSLFYAKLRLYHQIGFDMFVTRTKLSSLKDCFLFRCCFYFPQDPEMLIDLMYRIAKGYVNCLSRFTIIWKLSNLVDI